jgi:prevent-host-death family protein
MLTVPTAKAKGILSELIKRACKGEPVFIERYGKPVVALVPATSVQRIKRFGILAGKLRLPDDMDSPDRQTGGPS